MSEDDLQTKIDAGVTAALQKRDAEAAAKAAEAAAVAEKEMARRHAEAEAAAKQAQAAAHEKLADGWSKLKVKLGELSSEINTEVEAAANDPAKVNQADAFVRHGHLMVDEWFAWIRRV